MEFKIVSQVIQEIEKIYNGLKMEIFQLQNNGNINWKKCKDMMQI